MDEARNEDPVTTALALSRRAHESVEMIGLSDVADAWRARIAHGEIDERAATRLIAVGAVYPSDALIWLSSEHPSLADSSAMNIQIVADDPLLADHGLDRTATMAELLGQAIDIPVATAQLLVTLLNAESS
jgi:hypothetical protein